MKNSISHEKKVYQYLCKAIINGELKPGVKIQERKISNSLGVSRTPVREALRRLVSENLVSITTNKGAKVIKITREKLFETLEIRSILEGFAARQAAERINEDKIKELDSIYREMEEFLKKEDLSCHQIRPHYELLNHRFHKLIIQESKNSILLEIYNHLANFLLLCKIYSIFRKESLSEHKTIKDAIAAHDSKLAEKSSYEHVKNVYDTIVFLPE